MDFELRRWSEKDAESVAQYANNEKIANNLRNLFPYPYTLEDAKKYVNDCANNPEINQCCRAIVVEGKAVGSIGIFIQDDVHCKSAEIGYWLGESFWNRGIMTRAIQRLCKIGFDKYDIIRIFAESYAYNIGSRRALEKAGFILEGIMKKSIYKNGTILDSCMYALIQVI